MHVIDGFLKAAGVDRLARILQSSARKASPAARSMGSQVFKAEWPGLVAAGDRAIAKLDRRISRFPGKSKAYERTKGSRSAQKRVVNTFIDRGHAIP